MTPKRLILAFVLTAVCLSLYGNPSVTFRGLLLWIAAVRFRMWYLAAKQRGGIAAAHEELARGEKFMERGKAFAAAK
jgi:hypothetical protein